MQHPRPAHPPVASEAAQHVKGLLESLGVDLEDPELAETPARVAALLADLLRGFDPAAEPAFAPIGNADPGSGLVLARDLPFYSLCAHHLLPFFGRAHVAYLPGTRLAGIGDLARALDYHSRRLTLQERIATGVADGIERGLEPRGVAVLLEGRHLCLEMRGQRRRAVVESSAYRGVYADPERRAEFLERIRRG